MSSVEIAIARVFATKPYAFFLAYLNQDIFETAIPEVSSIRVEQMKIPLNLPFTKGDFQRGMIESSRLKTYISIAPSIKNRANQTRQSLCSLRRLESL